MNNLKKIILWTAGCNIELIGKHPLDHNKYVCIGLTIIYTSIMAGLSASYAFYSIFTEQIFAVGFGIFWGLIIFNLDRFIITSTGVSDGTSKITKEEFIYSLPRIILALLIGIIIAFPLELRMFEKEINAEIASKNDINIKNALINIDNRYSIIDTYFEEMDAIKTEMNLLKNNKDKLNKILSNDYSIKNLTSEEYKLFEEKFVSANNDYKNALPLMASKTSELNLIINNLSIEKEESIAKLKNTELRNSGLLSKAIALNNMTNESNTVLLMRIAITLLIILVEVAPILFKLMTVDGKYEKELCRLQK